MENIKSIKEQIKTVLYNNHNLTTKIHKENDEETLGITYSTKRKILTITIYRHEFRILNSKGTSELVEKENYKPDFTAVISDVKEIINKETNSATFERIDAKGLQCNSKLRIRFNEGDE